nr:mitochondrial glutamate carrier 1-like [Leptinotarsa decemlineata]
MAEKQSNFSLLPKIINGGIAGIVGVTCVFPLDLVKTRIQNQQIGKHGEKMYDNIIDAFRKTYKNEGFFGMYKGSSVNILLITPEKAIKLAGNDFFRFHLRTRDGRLPLYRQMLAGGLAGMCQIFITTPMELLKIQMQDAGRVATKEGNKLGKKISATKLTMDLLKNRGFFGLFKGIRATLIRDVSFSVMYFPLFATLNDMGPRKQDGSGEAIFWWTFLSGLLGGAATGLAVTPMDVVKTRLQTETKAKGEKQYTGMADAYT